MLNRVKAIENARKGIRINAVAPSYVSGPMINKFMESMPGFKEVLVMIGDLAMGRLVEPEEVAEAVAFLAGDAASYVNGQALVVDGGSLLPFTNRPFRK